MSRLLPHPWLILALAISWCALNASLHPAQLLLAAALGGLRFRVRLRHDRAVKPRPRVITVAPHGGVELVLERRAPAPAHAT